MGQWTEDPITGRWTWNRDGLVASPRQEPAPDDEQRVESKPTPYLRRQVVAGECRQ